MFGKSVNENPSAQQNGEKQSGEENSERMISAQKRDGDSQKSDFAGKIVVIKITIAHYFADRDHSRQRTGNRHRDNNLFFRRDLTARRNLPQQDQIR